MRACRCWHCCNSPLLAGGAAPHAVRARDWAVRFGRVSSSPSCCWRCCSIAASTRRGRLLQYAERVDLLLYHVGADGVTLFVLVTALIGLLLSLYEPARDRMRHLSLLVVIPRAVGADDDAGDHQPVWFVAASAAEIGLGPICCACLRCRRCRRTGVFALPAVSGLLVCCSSLRRGGAGLGPRRRHWRAWNFDLFELLLTPPAGKFQSAAFFPLFYGLAVRTPLFPLHAAGCRTWRSMAPSPSRRRCCSAFKVGIYGMVFSCCR